MQRHHQLVEESQQLSELLDRYLATPFMPKKSDYVHGHEFVFLSSNVSEVFVEPESLEDKENNDPKDTDGQTSRLWVDRFSPRRYTELLSDDVSFDFSLKRSRCVRRSCNDISCA